MLKVHNKTEIFSGLSLYRGIRMYGIGVVLRCTDICGIYGHLGAYGCTCLLTTSEGICKKLYYPLIISHVHYLSAEMEGKKTTKMPECPPINTNPNYPTKLIDG